MDRVVFAIGKCLIAFVQRLSITQAARLGRALGQFAFYIDKRHREVALANLTWIFGDKWDKRMIKKVAYENFKRIGENYVSAIRCLIMGEDEIKNILEVKGIEKLRLDDESFGHCRIMAIGHFGNFELYAKVTHYVPGFKFATTYRSINHPVINRLWMELRNYSGCLYFERRFDATKLHQALRYQRLILGLLCDQHGGSKGVVVPFLGKPASTTKAPAVYALRYRTPVFPAICYRKELGKWIIEVEDPIHVVDNSGNRSIEEILNDINHVFERAILRDPANWFWVHRRWKQVNKAPILKLNSTHLLA